MRTTAELRALGIDVGGTSVKAVVLDGAGRAVGLATSEPYTRPTFAELAAAIADASARAAGPAWPDIARVGMCLPGATDERGQRVERSMNIPALDGMPIAGLLPPAIRAVTPTILTDVHAAALDLWASERLAGRVLVVAIGTGVGAAVLDDGRLLRVTGRSSGHLGQIDVSPVDSGEIPIAPDGSVGTLEAYLGRAALLSRYRVSPEALADAIAPDSPPVRALAKALRIAHAIYRPHHVRLVGGLGIRLGRLVPSIRTLTAEGLTGLARPDWSLACGQDDFHAARGAAAAGDKDR